jgi:hypothetical protein
VSRDVDTKDATPINGGIRKDEVAKGTTRKRDRAYFLSAEPLSLETTVSPGRLTCAMRWVRPHARLSLFCADQVSVLCGLIAFVLPAFVLARPTA